MSINFNINLDINIIIFSLYNFNTKVMKKNKRRI